MTSKADPIAASARNGNGAGPYPQGSAWAQRCGRMFEDLRRPARAMVSRAYGRALSEEEIDDVYSAAWAATLSALRVRGEQMSDRELRAYVLTAVASHASKELRRRSRKPTAAIESAHEQVLFDAHSPLPDEAAVGSEAAGVARDLLTTLPQRRRAVMLLRYGWGLSPKEVCALVSGLSPRAYRKEVTRGVEQLIERLRLVESGEWCATREPLLRDYVAGTASEEERLQAEHHLRHCRACSTLASRLTGELHDLGAGVALAGAAGLVGGGTFGFAERLGGLLESGRAAIGSSAAGAGAATKVALGGGGKALLACLGTGAAATVCVAAGVVPGVDLGGGEDPKPGSASTRLERPSERQPSADLGRVSAVVAGGATSIAASEVDDGGRARERRQPEAEEPAAAADAGDPAPAPEEFDPLAEAAAAPAEPPPAAPEPAAAERSTESAATAGSGATAGDEFGP